MKLSALVLTYNEEEMIEDCLKQLDFAHEIIVLDQNSQDKTVKIASKYASKIISSSVEGFDKNRNTLAAAAKGEWLLYIDADERLTKELTSEIKQAIKAPRTAECSAFYFPRKNIILGKWLAHGGWWPDYIPRLFRKDKLKGWYGQVHESPKVDGSFGFLKTPIIHLTARSISQMLEKTTEWAKIEAQLFRKGNYPAVTIGKVVKSAMSEFFRRYVAKRGFLDGTVGLIEAIYQSFHQAAVLTYLWEAQHKNE